MFHTIRTRVLDSRCRGRARQCGVLFALCLVFTPALATADKQPPLSERTKTTIVALPRLAGPRLTAESLADKAIVVSFFASWCPPCDIEFMHLAELRAAYADAAVAIVAINLFEDFGGFRAAGSRLERFLARHGPTFAVVKGNDDLAARFGGIRRIPTLYVFDSAGRPVFGFIHKQGASTTNADVDAIRASIDRLLQ